MKSPETIQSSDAIHVVKLPKITDYILCSVSALNVTIDCP